MKKNNFYKLPFLLGCLVSILACEIPSLTTSPAPTPVPGVAETIIFETVAAARTQTARVNPPTQPPTATPTATRTPTQTPLPTITIILVLPTNTLIEQTLPAVGLNPFAFGSETSTPTKTTSQNSHNYQGTIKCSLVGRKPLDGTIFKPRQSFTARWTIKNTGTASWKQGWIDYRYLGGDKLHDRAAYDFKYILDPGETIDIKVDMHAPKNPGSYNTTWVMGLNKGGLCKMTLAIVVK